MLSFYIHSYLKRRKQNIKIDDILSTFQSLISGIPQGSNLGPILFNIFLNDLLATLENSEIYNFADDNTISSISKEKEALLTTLEKESQKAADWFRRNNMTVNPEKFQSMILERSGNSDVHTIEIDGNKIETTYSVDLLGIHIDNKLTFDDHIFTVCNKASMQLNAIGQLKRYLGKKELEVIVNSFIYSNFNYCPLVWHFSSCKALGKVESTHKRCLRMTHNDYDSDYETLLKISGTPTMQIKRIKQLAIEIFKTVNNLNTDFMKNIFTRKQNARVRPHDLLVRSHKIVTYGDKSLKILGPKVWNALPTTIKREASLSRFKEYVKLWSGHSCKCNLCKFI